MTLTSILPDELLYTAFTYLDSYQLGRSCRTSYRWHAVGSDPHLLRKHPLVDGKFKEKIVYDMITKDANDIEYLVGLSTPIFRSLKINKMTWCLIMDAARSIATYVATHQTSVAWYNVWQTAGEAAEHAAKNAVWYAARYVASSTRARGTKYTAWYAAYEAARYAINSTALVTYLNIWRNQNAKIIGTKSYQIVECLMLISMDTKFCRAVQEVAKDLPDCELPEEKLDQLSSNPWIKQYVELFGPFD